MKSVVLDGFAVNPGDLSWDFLSEFGCYRVYDKTAACDTAERIGDASIVLTNRTLITEEVLAQCPNIRYVTALGTGYDMIDVAACRRRGVEVCNVPGYSTVSVAQFAFTLLLALTTDLQGFRGIVKAGTWTGMPGLAYQNVRYTELAGKTVGIYGCGAIGRRFGALCLAFGMRVLGYRRSLIGVTEEGIDYVGEEQLLSESDILSLHCPLTEQTRGLVDRDFLSRLKPGAFLINTSRGAVVNEEALAEALESGRLAGAALDVMCSEPPAPDNPLLRAPNCIITPHCAWTTKESRLRLLDSLALNIRSFLATGAGVNRVF